MAKRTSQLTKRRPEIPASAVSAPIPKDHIAVVDGRGEATVVLTVDAVSAFGKKAPAGSVIAPNVEGWPDHRVHAHLRDGRAKRG